MSTLFILRHGLSKGNENKIIQGYSTNYELSSTGIKEVNDFSKKNLDVLNKVDFILSGRSLRTTQTADIINTYINVPHYKDFLIYEFGSGVLQDIPHKEAEEKYKYIYDIWKCRGDLDYILGAELGNELQARVLIFLLQFMDNDKMALIVGHAGFNRCLINTALGRQRNETVEIGHNYMHTIESPWSKIEYFIIKDSQNKKIIKVNTFDNSYIIKIIKRKINKADIAIHKVMQKIYSETRIIPQHYCCLENNNNNSTSTVFTQEFLDGKHIKRKFTNDETDKIVNLVYLFYRKMVIYKSLYEDEVKDVYSLENKIKNKVDKIEDDNIKHYGMIFLEDKDFSRYLKESEKILVHFDLHKQNIIKQENQFKLIDLDSLVYAPKEFQLACLILSCFLFYSFSEEMIDYIISLWPEVVDYNILNKLMRVRCFLGLSHFYIKLRNNESSIDDHKKFKRYIYLYNRLNK